MSLRPVLRDHVEQSLPDRGAIDHAFWQACNGRQLRIAAYMLEHGADVDATPAHNTARPIKVAGAPDTRRGLLIHWQRQPAAI